MLRHITKTSGRAISLGANHGIRARQVNAATLKRFYATSPSDPKPTQSTTPPTTPPTPTPTSSAKPTPTPSSTTPPPASSTTTPPPSSKPSQPEAGKATGANQEGQRARGERTESGGGGSTFLIMNLLVLLGLGGYGYYQWQQDPNYPAKVQRRVTDTVSYIQEKIASLSASSPSTPKIPPPHTTQPPTHKEEPSISIPPPPPAPLDDPLAREEVDVVPVEIIEVIEVTPAPEPAAVITEHVVTPPTEEPSILLEPPPLILDEPAILIMPEEVVSRDDISDVVPQELLREFLERLSPPPPHPSIDLEGLLREQAAQLDALKEKLSLFESSQNQRAQETVDLQTTQSQATEQAYREVLALHDRIHRKELSEKLEQAYREAEQKLSKAAAELKAQYEAQIQKDRSDIHSQFQQQYEKDKAELQRSTDESLKAALETAHAQYSVRLAEEINKFDSKLMAEIQNEDAKYNQSHNERMQAIAKLRSEVLGLEASLNANALRLQIANNLHDVSAAVFELGQALSSPTRVSFINELEKLETAGKTLGNDSVITTVAEVLRPIAAGGIVPYNELSDRFKTVVASGRQAALVPEGGGMVGNLVAAVASRFIIPAKGPTVQGDSPEAIFAKAEYYFENGELNEAVAQLAQLRGMPLSITRDWLQAASDRLVVENSIKALHSHVVVLSHQ